MLTKSISLSLSILLLVSGCSSIKQVSLGDFMSDTEVNSENVDNSLAEQENMDPVLESTKAALEANPEPLAAKFKPLDQPIVHTDVWERLPDTFQLSDIQNLRIETQKNWYLKHPDYLTRVSERAEPFLYFIAEEVEKRNIPGEIALLPIIESAFLPQAHSHQSAAGLWQFVPATGRHFGLKQNWWYDGRRDIYLSTHAALTYLEQLNKYYKGDWLLTLAAYNAGSGNVNKAVRKNRKKGKPIDYWSLDLPKETKNYVPKLLAVAQLIQNAKAHNITLHSIDNSPRLMRVDIKSQIDLSLVSKFTNINIDEIKTYNPAFKQWATDPEGPHYLLLPIDKVSRFESQLASIDNSERVQYYRHKIRSGESLSVIAKKYHLSIKALKTANKLKNSRIRAGKYLMVPLPNNTDIASLGSQKTTHRSKLKDKPKNINGQTYTVKRGDSFWTIARRYKLSHRKLASMNNLSTGDTLSIGQVLVVNLHKNNKKADTALDSIQPINYKVKRGDSLYVISRRFNVSINELRHWNDLHSNKYLQPGQELKVYIETNQSQTI